MKSIKIIFILYILVFLFSGCAVQKDASSDGDAGAEATTVPQVTPSEDVPAESLPGNNCEAVLLDGSVSTGANTWHVPNEALESLETPELLELGGNILAAGISFDGNSDAALNLKLVSIFDGSLLGEAVLQSSGFSYVQSSEDRVGVSDAGQGTVHILDDKLNVLSTFVRSPSGEFWCLSTDFTKLYVLSWVDGIYSLELETGEIQPVFPDVADFMVRTCVEEYIAFSCVDRNTQKNINAVLDLNTGEIIQSPVAGKWTNLYYSGNDTWLLCGVTYVDDCLLAQDGQSKLISCSECRMELLMPANHLLRETAAGSMLSLYETDGSFISACDRSVAEGRYAGDSYLWSDLYGGYFFMDYKLSRYGRLVFWDINVPMQGAELELVVPELDGTGGETAAPALYERAEELSERFDVEIRIADQCTLDYPHFNAYSVQAEGFITDALDILESTLSAYPDGFFTQLQYGSIQTVRFELVGGLSAKGDTSDEEYTGSYTGYAQEETDHYLVVMDVYMMSERTVYHEIAHIIDARLAFDARLRPQAMFSEEDWLSLQPEGFEYARTYGDMPPEVIKYANSGYFVRDYSCRYPTEDRATMMETAMAGDVITFDVNPFLVDKLKYYSLCIRDCFDSDGWPQVTAWEKMIR